MISPIDRKYNHPDNFQKNQSVVQEYKNNTITAYTAMTCSRGGKRFNRAKPLPFL